MEEKKMDRDDEEEKRRIREAAREDYPMDGYMGQEEEEEEECE